MKMRKGGVENGLGCGPPRPWRPPAAPAAGAWAAAPCGGGGAACCASMLVPANAVAIASSEMRIFIGPLLELAALARAGNRGRALRVRLAEPVATVRHGERAVLFR